MTNPLDAAELHIKAGQFDNARDALEQLRPGQQEAFPALRLWAQCHAGAGRWEKVDVICRIIRRDYPQEPFGYAQAAHSLREQGRAADAAMLLSGIPASASV